MKKIFSYIGLLTIITISIIMSNKTATVVKNIDSLMTEIKEKAEEYNIQPESAIIKNNTIIPGMNGKKINIEKTYKNMKKIGKFNEKYIIYEQIKPEISIENNKNKYIIGGNKTNKKNEIGLIIEINETCDIENILKILEKNQAKITFYIQDKIKQNKNIKQIKKAGYKIEIGTTNNCILAEKNDTKLNTCSKQNKYTIIPNIIINKSLFNKTKQQLKPGAIIKIQLNQATEKELDMTIKYIKTKGYIIKDLDEYISEKNNN